MSERYRKETFDSIQHYLVTGKAEYPPACPTLEKGLTYYRHRATEWLQNTNWRLQDVILVTAGISFTICLEAAERMHMVIERNGRKRDLLRGFKDDYSADGIFSDN